MELNGRWRRRREDEEELNQFTAIGLRRDKGRQRSLLSPKMRQWSYSGKEGQSRDMTVRVMTPVGGHWER